ncbi:DUF7288 family protein [Halalkalicoccus tibetensis]|uniref:Uncharacterized protein n=1 Tax=Halalkalicoccus tibetensis TaxID=175632 RepID=A0ABD5V4B2_9EURY
MRAQAHTLEAFAAAVILIASLLFAMQVTAVTPLSASTSSQHIENQQRAAAEDVLRAADGAGELEETVLYWNDAEGTFHGLEGEDDDHYAPGELDTDLGDRLTGAFSDRGVAYNLHVDHVDGEGSVERQRIVHAGEPSDHAVSATRLRTLYGEDPFYDEGGPTDDELGETDEFYVENTNEESFYAVVEVEVVVWRM